MALPSVGKASGLFSSLKSGFPRRPTGQACRIGLPSAPSLVGTCRAGRCRRAGALGFRFHNVNSASSWHVPPWPGLTDFDGVWTGWAEF